MTRHRSGRQVLTLLVGLSLACLGLQPAMAAIGRPVQAGLNAGDGPVVAAGDAFNAEGPALKPGQIEMTTVSTRPALVTGRMARVQVRGLQPDDSLTVTVDRAVTAGAADLSAAFAPVASLPGRAPGIREGLVTGLQPGANRFSATATDRRYGSRSVRLTILDHSIDGPVISGPHQVPFVCETAASGLGAATGPNCDHATTLAWYAHNYLGQWVALADPYKAPPAGTQMISVGGHVVPFVVRIETAVINRSITRIAVLDNPAERGAGKPFSDPEWGRNLLYQFGESCGTGFHQGNNQASDVFGQITNISGSNLAGPTLDLAGHLRDGWMVAESSLTTFGVSCNPLTSAETLMMVKEHIVDSYGDIAHTIGAGASGGAIQQYLAANNYPGLIDAGTPLFSFPDILTTAMTVTDCTLLNRVFASNPNRWTQAKQNAITGEFNPQVCQDWQSLFGGDLSPKSCPSGVPSSQVYDAKTNPHGVRCDLEDDDVNGLGRDSSGHALLPLSNAGVQYGLEALRSGAISADDFVTLNRALGGLDHDGNIVGTRNTLAPSAAAYLYSTGEITGRGALAETPIIDQSIPAGDVVPSLDIHQQVWPYAMQQRLAAAGDRGSQVVWSGVPLPADAVDVTNDWLDNLDRLHATHPGWSRAQLVAAARPSAAANQCRVGVVGVPVACDNGVLAHGNPRSQADGPGSMDNIDCRLRPVTASDYPGSITRGALAAIRAAFPTGVCDWSAPPVGWTAGSQTWLSFGGDTLLTPPVPVPWELVRSAVPLDHGGGGAGAGGGHHRGGGGPGGGGAGGGLGPALAVGETVHAVGRAVSTVIDLLP